MERFARRLPNDLARQGARMVVEALSADVVDGSFALVELAVDPAWQGRGVGGRLPDALLVAAARPRRWLLTSPESAAAPSLYTGRGWRRAAGAVRATSDGRPLALLVHDS